MTHRSKKRLGRGNRQYFNEQRSVNLRIDSRRGQMSGRFDVQLRNCNCGAPLMTASARALTWHDPGFSPDTPVPDWCGRLIANWSSSTEGEATGDCFLSSSHVIRPVMHSIVSASYHLYVGTSIQTIALLLTLYTFDRLALKIALYFR